eukprot:TRINITY_DN62208_c0_g1_i1.p1 TRINITY_DN62208_c0_g1~~TRINITY_DN62208_c0_g1_i1.p1  ORF type:complete len:1202 (+),score=249.69 TRINITY_DN62208_c0_g1_i1:55-3660(+)
MNPGRHFLLILLAIGVVSALPGAWMRPNRHLKQFHYLKQQKQETEEEEDWVCVIPGQPEDDSFVCVIAGKDEPVEDEDYVCVLTGDEKPDEDEMVCVIPNTKQDGCDVRVSTDAEGTCASASGGCQYSTLGSGGDDLLVDTGVNRAKFEVSVHANLHTPGICGANDLQWVCVTAGGCPTISTGWGVETNGNRNTGYFTVEDTNISEGSLYSWELRANGFDGVVYHEIQILFTNIGLYWTGGKQPAIVTNQVDTVRFNVAPTRGQTNYDGWKISWNIPERKELFTSSVSEDDTVLDLQSVGMGRGRTLEPWEGDVCVNFRRGKWFVRRCVTVTYRYAPTPRENAISVRCSGQGSGCETIEEGKRVTVSTNRNNWIDEVTAKLEFKFSWIGHGDDTEQTKTSTTAWSSTLGRSFLPVLPSWVTKVQIRIAARDVDGLITWEDGPTYPVTQATAEEEKEAVTGNFKDKSVEEAADSVEASEISNLASYLEEESTELTDAELDQVCSVAYAAVKKGKEKEISQQAQAKVVRVCTERLLKNGQIDNKEKVNEVVTTVEAIIEQKEINKDTADDVVETLSEVLKQNNEAIEDEQERKEVKKRVVKSVDEVADTLAADLKHGEVKRINTETFKVIVRKEQKKNDLKNSEIPLSETNGDYALGIPGDFDSEDVTDQDALTVKIVQIAKNTVIHDGQKRQPKSPVLRVTFIDGDGREVKIRSKDGKKFSIKFNKNDFDSLEEGKEYWCARWTDTEWFPVARMNLDGYCDGDHFTDWSIIALDQGTTTDTTDTTDTTTDQGAADNTDSTNTDTASTDTAGTDTATDVNECTNGSHDCDANASCTDTADSFTCACNTGYSGDGRSCTDINECTQGTANCDVNADCTNTAGSFTCACVTGYSGDGTTCTADGTDSSTTDSSTTDSSTTDSSTTDSSTTDSSTTDSSTDSSTPAPKQKVVINAQYKGDCDVAPNSSELKQAIADALGVSRDKIELNLGTECTETAAASKRYKIRVLAEGTYDAEIVVHELTTSEAQTLEQKVKQTDSTEKTDLEAAGFVFGPSDVSRADDTPGSNDSTDTTDSTDTNNNNDTNNTDKTDEDSGGKDDDDGGFPIWAIILIIILVLLLICVIVFIIVYCCCLKNRDRVTPKEENNVQVGPGNDGTTATPMQEQPSAPTRTGDPSPEMPPAQDPAITTTRVTTTTTKTTVSSSNGN